MMNFSAALSILQGGTDVRRKAWNEEILICKLASSDYIHMMVGDFFHPWIPQIEDMTATDWEIVH